jgi:hypothetical protein
MRGDFIHAGGASWLPRCHMKFYPTANAGNVKGHSHHYWLHPDFQCDLDEERSEFSQVERSFLWQHYSFPFAYPTSTWVYNKEIGDYEEILRYHTDVTQVRLNIIPALRPPLVVLTHFFITKHSVYHVSLDDKKEGRKRARVSLSERAENRRE